MINIKGIKVGDRYYFKFSGAILLVEVKSIGSLNQCNIIKIVKQSNNIYNYIYSAQDTIYLLPSDGKFIFPIVEETDEEML